jgi:hypothetical protein
MSGKKWHRLSNRVPGRPNHLKLVLVDGVDLGVLLCSAIPVPLCLVGHHGLFFVLVDVVVVEVDTLEDEGERGGDEHHLDWLQQDQPREEGDDERGQPLVGLVVAELDGVGPEEEERDGDAQDAEGPADEEAVPGEDNLLFSWSTRFARLSSHGGGGLGGRGHSVLFVIAAAAAAATAATTTAANV